MKMSLADVLTRLASELRTSADASAALEAVVQEALAAQVSSGQQGSLQKLQHMDLLTQTLADFARFTEVIAEQVPSHVVNLEGALAGLHLQDLRQALAGNPPNSSKDAGHVDVF